MGQNFLRQQASNHAVQRDEATAELEEPQLYERPEVIQSLYTIEPDDGERLAVGSRLYIQPDPFADLLIAVEGHRRIGRITGESAAALRSVLTVGDRSSMVEVQVVTVQPISGIAYANIVRHQQS